MGRDSSFIYCEVQGRAAELWSGSVGVTQGGLAGVVMGHVLGLEGITLYAYHIPPQHTPIVGLIGSPNWLLNS
jgi:hypothetical protein